MTPAPILLAHHGLDWITGSERCLLDLVEHLDRDRYRPVVVCNAKALAEAAGSLGATVYFDTAYKSPDTLLPPPALRAEGHRIVRRERIALVHANDFDPFKWLLPASRAARIPTLLHVHLPSTEEERCYSFVHQASRIVGVSRAAIAGFLEDGIAAGRTMVIYNAVDPVRLERGDASALRDRLGIGRDERVLVAVASLIRRKGSDIVLRAAARLRELGRSRFRVLIVGDGPERGALEELSRSLRLGDAALFLGRLPSPGAILRDTADIAVTAARQEAFPLSVLEAGYFGLPVVASDIAPHREAIENGQTGLLFGVDDPAALAESIGGLLDEPARARTLGNGLAERVRSEFLIDRYLERFSAAYDELLSAPRRQYGWTGTWVWPRAYTRWVARKLGFRAAAVPRAANAAG